MYVNLLKYNKVYMTKIFTTVVIKHKMIYDLIKKLFNKKYIKLENHKRMSKFFNAETLLDRY